MSSYIHFIRHGITEAIQKHLFYGWADIPVVDEGFKAIAEFIKAGVYPDADADTEFFTSGMLRANQTLNYIYGDVPFTEIPDLKEINFGDWEMKHYKELENDGQWDNWMNDTTGEFAFPNGDSILDFYARIQLGLEELLRHHRAHEERKGNSSGERDTVSILACHGGTISASMIHWFPDDKGSFWEWTPSTGRGYTVEFVNGKPVRWVEI